MLSLCTFVKDEENCIEHMYRSVQGHVSEFVVVDTGSSDRTIEICKDLGARVYKAGLFDFASIRTLASHLAREPWVLMLDADESLNDKRNRLIHTCLYGGADAYAFPRRRWLDLAKTKQTEIEAFPDWQVRLYRNNPKFYWERELHERFVGAEVKKIGDGPTIDHFHDIFKTPKKLKKREQLYRHLAERAGVAIEGGKPLG